MYVCHFYVSKLPIILYFAKMFFYVSHQIPFLTIFYLIQC